MQTPRSDTTFRCPGCGTVVDPLRAGAACILDGKISYFCSPACRERVRAAGAASHEPPRTPERAAQPSEPAQDAPAPEALGPDDTRQSDGTQPSASSPSETIPAEFPAPTAVPTPKPARDTGRMSGAWWVAAAAATAVLGAMGILLRHNWPLLVGGAAAAAVVWAVASWRSTPREMRGVPLYPAAAVLAALGAAWNGIEPPTAAAAPFAILLAGGAVDWLRWRVGAPLSDAAVVSWLRADAPWAAVYRWSLRAGPVAAILLGAAAAWWGTPDTAVWVAAFVLLIAELGTAGRDTALAHAHLEHLMRRQGVRIADRSAAIRARRLDTAIICPAGVLTTYVPTLRDVQWRDDAEQTTIRAAVSAVMAQREDRYALAWQRHWPAPSQDGPLRAVHHPARGVAADTLAGRLLVGNSLFLLENDISTALCEPWLHEQRCQGRHAVLIARNGRIAATAAIEEHPLPEAEEALHRLARTGITPLVYTSAEPETAQVWGRWWHTDSLLCLSSTHQLDAFLHQWEQADTPSVLVGNGPAFENLVGRRTCRIAAGTSEDGETTAEIDARGAALPQVVSLLVSLRTLGAAVRGYAAFAALWAALGIIWTWGWHTPAMLMAYHLVSRGAAMGMGWAAGQPHVWGVSSMPRGERLRKRLLRRRR